MTHVDSPTELTQAGSPYQVEPGNFMQTWSKMKRLF